MIELETLQLIADGRQNDLRKSEWNNSGKTRVMQLDKSERKTFEMTFVKYSTANFTFDQQPDAS